MWNLHEWIFFKKNLLSMLEQNTCRLTFNNNKFLICNYNDVKIDDIRSAWILNAETNESTLIDLTTITRIEILD